MTFSNRKLRTKHVQTFHFKYYYKCTECAFETRNPDVMTPHMAKVSLHTLVDELNCRFYNRLSLSGLKKDKATYFAVLVLAYISNSLVQKCIVIN